ncbi:MAG: transcriptional regulator [Desulfurococcaceae archaeon]
MKPFCEILNRKIMPAVKTYVARKLVLQYGFTQLSAAKILGIKQTLVNYVVTGRRKVKYLDIIESIEGLRDFVDDMIIDIVNGSMNRFDQCRLCSYLISNENIYRFILSAIGEEHVYVKPPFSKYTG